jgi:hypothetical protein
MFALMDKLREQAPHAGGGVLSHLGNHEVSTIINVIQWSLTPPTAHEFNWRLEICILF